MSIRKHDDSHKAQIQDLMKIQQALKINEQKSMQGKMTKYQAHSRNGSEDGASMESIDRTSLMYKSDVEEHKSP